MPKNQTSTNSVSPLPAAGEGLGVREINRPRIKWLAARPLEFTTLVGLTNLGR